MNGDIQLSLIPDLVPEGAFTLPVKVVSTVISKPKSVKPINQGDVVETPVGDRGIVMLVNPLGDCYVEVKGQPFVYLQSDLKRLPIMVISPALTLHQVYVELHAYRCAISQATNEEVRAQLRQAMEIRERFLNAASNTLCVEGDHA